MLHQEGNVLTQIPSDEELCDSVLKELGSRRSLAAGLEEVCDVTLLVSALRKCEGSYFYQSSQLFNSTAPSKLPISLLSRAI